MLLVILGSPGQFLESCQQGGWLWREWVRWVSAMGVCSRHFESEQASGMSDKRVRVKLRMSMVLVDVWV